MEIELYTLLKGDKEREGEGAKYFFMKIAKGAVADSIGKAMAIKFPNGKMAWRNAANEIYEEKDEKKMESLYKAFIKKFPPPKTSSLLQYDYLRSAGAKLYLRQ